LKTWPTIALVVVGLSYVLYFQLGLHAQYPAEIAAASAAEIQAPAPRPQPAPKTPARATKWAFGGYPCPGTCAEGKDGYSWGKDHGITDPDECTGKTGPFIEGCRVYARQQRGARALR
jgi:hypothetical protein